MGDTAAFAIDSSVFSATTTAINVCLESYNELGGAFSRSIATASIQTVETSMQRVSASIEEGEKKTKGMASAVQDLTKKFMSMDTLKSIVAASDAYTQMNTKLNTINDNLQSTDQLQSMVFGAAQRSRTEYASMAQTVAGLSVDAGGIFASSAETVAFAENMNKMFISAGASQQEMEAASQGLTGALSSGVLGSEELLSVFQTAPNAVQILADYLDQPADKIMQLATNGEISAGVFKDALLSATDDINGQLDSTPMTWGQVWQTASNQVLLISQPLLDIITALAENWDVLQPLVIGVAVAVGLYGAALLAYNVVQAGASALTAVHTALTGGQAAATAAGTAAQTGFNAALLANPITLVILALIILISILFAVVAHINNVTGSTLSATGMITGVISTAVAFIGNLFYGLLELIFGLINTLINPFVVVANFFANVWKSPISSVIYLFQGLADCVLGILESIAGAIDAVFGTNFAGTVSGWRTGLKGLADDAVAKFAKDEEYENVAETVNFSIADMGIERNNYKDAYDSGEAWGAGLEEKIKGFDPKGMIAGGLGEAGEYGDVLSGAGEIEVPGATEMGENVAGIADNTGRAADAMEMSEEDMKYLKDIAEREVIDRTVFSTIAVDMGGVNNTVNNMSDLDSIGQYLSDTLQNTMAMSAEGVH